MSDGAPSVNVAPDQSIDAPVKCAEYAFPSPSKPPPVTDEPSSAMPTTSSADARSTAIGGGPLSGVTPAFTASTTTLRLFGSVMLLTILAPSVAKE